MDSISSADLMQIIQNLAELAGLQYQYWLATTFATIVAAFVARNHLATRLKVAVAGLYLMASVLFLLIYVNTIDGYTGFATVAIERGIMEVVSYGPAIPALRFIIWLTGTIVTVWFIFQHDTGSDV